MKTFLLLLVAAFVFGSDAGFRFAVIGDRNGDYVGDVFDEIISEVRLLKPDLVMCVGDLIAGYTDDTMALHAQWDTVLNSVHKLPCTFYFVPGNHDMQNETDRRIFKQRTGCNRYYSFDYENSHFVVLDNSMTQWTLPQDIDQEQLAWLKKDLEANKNADNIFAFYHVPTYIYAQGGSTQDSFVKLFETYGVRTVFTGHHHAYSCFKQNAVEYINVGSSGGALDTRDFARGHFFHYLMVSVHGTEHEIAVIRKGNVFAPDVVTLDDLHLIERADTEVVKMTDCVVNESLKNSTQRFSVTLDNYSTDSITQSLQWKYDSQYYTFKPALVALALGPQEKADYSFNLTIADGSNVFPIPQFVLEYPFTHGKVCTLRHILSMKRDKDVARVMSPPMLDGRLDDQAWKTVKPITTMGTYDGKPQPNVEKVEVYLCHDADNVYIGARCYESDLSLLRAQAVDHDGATYSDDNLWFFFDPDFDKETYVQAIINSNGVVFDRSCALKRGALTRDLTWNGPWEITHGREENAWILELKIPKKGLEPYSDKQWGFNFRRLQTRVNDASFWNVPFAHNPTYFGTLSFK